MWTENWSTLSDTVSCGGRVSGLRDLSVTCADRQFDFAAVASIVLSLQFSDSNYLNLYALCPISTLRVCIARSTNAKALKLAWLCVKRAAAKSISMLKHELRAAVRFRILPFPMRWPVCFLHVLATYIQFCKLFFPPHPTLAGEPPKECFQFDWHSPEQWVHH